MRLAPADGGTIARRVMREVGSAVEDEATSNTVLRRLTGKGVPA